jgi:hypothetical protein
MLQKFVFPCLVWNTKAVCLFLCLDRGSLVCGNMICVLKLFWVFMETALVGLGRVIKGGRYANYRTRDVNL